MKKSHANWVKENCNYILDKQVSRGFLEQFHKYVVEKFNPEKLTEKDFVLFWKLIDNNEYKKSL